ncbi:holin family protein [Aestuariibius sp. 2305UL40-4]|uniref:holin family protein n=1 Tax=Aestuariibius violaceus TaxID=3234132 RepID=UPI00345E88EC
MGLIGRVMTLIFGGGRNVVKETAEVFRENAEAAGVRQAALKGQALEQYAAEFGAQRGWFDVAMDGLNRLPRPLLAFGTLGLFVAAMVDPVWFASRMQGIALVPDPLWWLMGAIVSFYFGARHQIKSQEFQRSVAATMAQVPQVVANAEALEAMRPKVVGRAATEKAAGLTLSSVAAAENPALRDWQAARP